MKRFSLSLLLFFVALFSQAQNAVMSEPQMADKFRQDGKIYIVITVIAMIFAAIVVFLTILERKIKKMETKINELNSSS